jgi:hypothetical protein
MRALRIVKSLLVLCLLGFGAMLLYGYSRNHPEDMPWTELDLAQPIGAFTGHKLAALDREGGSCKALLRRTGVRFNALPPRSGSAQCGYADAVRFSAGGALDIDYRPRDLGTSCPVAAGLALWEWHVVQPAAIQHFGAKVEAIDHFGSFSCRRIYGRSEGSWSEHSTATKDQKQPSSGTYATVPARSSPPCSRPNTTPRTATICTSTRRTAARSAGADAASGRRSPVPAPQGTSSPADKVRRRG